MAGEKAKLNQLPVANSTSLQSPLAKEMFCQCLVTGWQGIAGSKDLRKPNRVVSKCLAAEL